MKNENKTKILFLVVGVVIGIVLTMLFQIAISGNANKSLAKQKSMGEIPFLADGGCDGTSASYNGPVIDPETGVQYNGYVSCTDRAGNVSVTWIK